MSRFTTFTDFANQQTEDVIQILDEIGVSVAVYRQPEEQTGSPGFDGELVAQVFLKTILVTPPNQLNRASQPISDTSKGTVLQFVSLTQESDVRQRDIWKFKGKEYHVIAIDETAPGKIEVQLERRI